MKFSQKMPLYFFYTMVQKSQKWPKTQIKGESCLKWCSLLCSNSHAVCSFSRFVYYSRMFVYLPRGAHSMLGNAYQSKNFQQREFTPWPKDWENRVHLGTGACSLEHAHACSLACLAVSFFFGQGSTCIHCSHTLTHHVCFTPSTDSFP